MAARKLEEACEGLFEVARELDALLSSCEASVRKHAAQRREIHAWHEQQRARQKRRRVDSGVAPSTGYPHLLRQRLSQVQPSDGSNSHDHPAKLDSATRVGQQQRSHIGSRKRALAMATCSDEILQQPPFREPYGAPFILFDHDKYDVCAWWLAVQYATVG